MHGKIDDNFKVINQNLLHPYDKQCRGYILFVSDVLRVREVLGPQTSNRVVVVPQSTQWKLQEFLASKSASDIINLLLIGESLSADPTKVLFFSLMHLLLQFYLSIIYNNRSHLYMCAGCRNDHMFSIRINYIQMAWARMHQLY